MTRRVGVSYGIAFSHRDNLEVERDKNQMIDDNAYNPFAHSGNIVYGEKFVGRQEAIRTIQQRVINSSDPGCLAIVGSPRIGKSSLAYHTLIHPQALLFNKKIITIWISLPNFKSHEQLFRGLVNHSLDALDDAGLEDEKFFKIGQILLEKNLVWEDIQYEVGKFFRKINRAGWRVVSVIDEFDEARHIFQDGEGFLALRNLAYEPQYGVTLVTTSRRPLPEITNKCRKDVSNFDNIFIDEYLRCFENNELTQLVDRLKIIGLEINDNIINFVWDNTGGHPHLASVLLFQISNSWLQEREYNLERILINSASEFLKYYDKIFELLQEDGSFDKTLLEILLGPITQETLFKADKLARYGLIKKTKNGYYTTFSLHFEDYLRRVSRSKGLRHLWNETEEKLWLLVDQIMAQKYQTVDWISALEAVDIDLKTNVFDKCRELQRREQSRFGSSALVSLLYFTDMGDLGKIISRHWSLFEPILGKDKDYWHRCLQFLSTLRNPMLYNRENKVFATYEIQKAEEYCQEILTSLSKLSAPLNSKPSDSSSLRSVTINADKYIHNGNMMPEEKSNIDARGSKFGGGLAGGNQTGGTFNDHSITYEPKQTLAQAAQEIQQLLKQLEENNPDATEAEQKAFVTAMIPPTKRERFFNALKACGKATVEEFLDNPYLNVTLATIEGWQEGS